MDGLCEVRFEPPGRTVWVQPGTTILAAAAAAGVEIVTGCTRGMCGTDPVRITQGLAALEPATGDERATLERMGLSADYRLSCSAKLRWGVVVVGLDTY